MSHDTESRRLDDAEDLRAVEATLGGDHSAFGHIVDRYTPVLYSWLYTIAVNYLRNARDKRRRRGSDNVLPYEDRVPSASMGTPLGDPELELDRSEGEALVRRAIGELSPRKRTRLVFMEPHNDKGAPHGGDVRRAGRISSLWKGARGV
jgi:DNA-directed RNA polymerase specialized sigma24 family protein